MLQQQLAYRQPCQQQQQQQQLSLVQPKCQGSSLHEPGSLAVAAQGVEGSGRHALEHPLHLAEVGFPVPKKQVCKVKNPWLAHSREKGEAK